MVQSYAAICIIIDDALNILESAWASMILISKPILTIINHNLEILLTYN